MATGAKSMVPVPKVLGVCLAEVADPIEEGCQVVLRVRVKAIHGILRKVNESTAAFGGQAEGTGPGFYNPLCHVGLVRCEVSEGKEGVAIEQDCDVIVHPAILTGLPRPHVAQISVGR